MQRIIDLKSIDFYTLEAKATERPSLQESSRKRSNTGTRVKKATCARKAAVPPGVKNWPYCDFFFASVFLDRRIRACSTSNSNQSSPISHSNASDEVEAACRRTSRALFNNFIFT